MMTDSEEEYILDFKAEEKRTHMTVIEIDDNDSNCSTISASEVNSNSCISPTPPLYFKLKKARVMIKKLPRDVLAKYNLNSKKTSLSPLPVRMSRRIEGKQIPGQYLSLHVNKPLNEIANKKKRLREHLVKPAGQNRTENQTKKFQKNKSVYSHSHRNFFKTSVRPAKLPGKSYNNTNKPTAVKTNSEISCLPNRRKLHDTKIKAAKRANVNKLLTPKSLPTSQFVNSNKQGVSINCHSLHERMASTRLINNDPYMYNPVSSILPSLPNVVITKYNIPPNSFVGTRQNSSTLPLSNTINPFVFNEPANISSHVAPSIGNSYKQNAIMVSKPQHNVNVNVPLRPGAAFPNYSHMQNTQSSKAFPTLITHAAHLHQSHPMVLNAAAPKTIKNVHQLSSSTQRTVTVQNVAVPQHLSKKDSVIATYPKVLIINKPPLPTDPLDMPNSSANNKNLPEKPQVVRENNADSDVEPYPEYETDLEVSDTEKRTEPEVIKRIIYHTKSVQTRFTCNSSICGLVDSDGFNLNCFYCYDIFPLHKWLEFKEHIKRVHHVEEKQNQSDSDEEIDISNSVDSCPLGTCQESSLKSISNKENCVTKAANTTEQVLKKLPLEPKLASQRLNRTTIAAQKILSSLSEITSYSSKQVKQLRVKSSSGRQVSNTNFNNSRNNEIINLESDDCDDDVTKTEASYMQESKGTTNNNSNLNNSVSRIDEVSKLIPPTLSHITIKKVEKVSSKEPISLPQSASGSSYLKESVIKLPSNLNIQKVIKTLPKPTTQQLSANGRIRPRYFVVKKIIKLPTTEALPNINLSKGMILTKMPELKKDNAKNDCDDDMPSNDENEDSVPKPTNGRGILFGVTNSMVVIEFLLKLKTFPELWRSQLKNNTSTNFNEGIKKMCFHLNNRFDLNITDLEMRQSLQRVRNWYCRILKNIHEHNQNLNNTEPYKHKFPLYFRILHQFLTSDVDSSTKPDTSAHKCLQSMEYKAGNANVVRLDEKIRKVEPIKSKTPIATNFKLPQPIIRPSTTRYVTPTAKDNTTVPDTTDSLIEFDADTLYDHESGGEETLEEFEVTKISNQTIDQFNGPKKKRRKACVDNFECDVCRKTYKRIYELKRHKVLHFPPQFECGLCSQKFYFKRWAEKCSHLKKKKYRRVEKTSEQDNSMETFKPKRIWPKKIFRFKMICEICGASYRSIGSLNTHKRDKHLNQREKCVVCNFTALSNWRIVQHQKKRHIVEPGTVEEVAKKSRARTDTKTPFSNEARQEFFWRREMRKKLKPGEIFYGCCKCRMVFNSRKEKVLHNKLEHPIKETTVICLLCLPNKLFLTNSNCARRHYTDIHKVAWHEIDDLVKRTKPIFTLLNKEEIELLKTSENYKELLEELLKDKQLGEDQKLEILEDETLNAVHNLSVLPNMKELTEDVNKIDEEYTQEENVYVDCIIDHDYSNEDVFNEHEYANNNEHNYSEEQESNENFDDNDIVSNQNSNDLYSHHACDDGIIHLDYDIENNVNKIYNSDQNDEDYLQSNVDDFIEGELVEECIVVEECIDEVVGEEKYF